MKKYNTPHRHRVIKTRLTEEEYAEFSERVTLCKMSQAEFIRQALIKSSIRPVITVSPVNDELLSAVGKLTAEYGKIGGNLNQIARCLNEYGAPYNALSQEVRAALSELAALKFEVLQKVGEAVGNIQTCGTLGGHESREHRLSALGQRRHRQKLPCRMYRKRPHGERNLRPHDELCPYS